MINPLAPLSQQSLAVLNNIESRNGLVFALNGTKPFNVFSRAKRHLDQMSEVTGWRLHDLRRTCVSGMARLGVAPHVADKILNIREERSPGSRPCTSGTTSFSSARRHSIDGAPMSRSRHAGVNCFASGCSIIFQGTILISSRTGGPMSRKNLGTSRLQDYTWNSRRGCLTPPVPHRCGLYCGCLRRKDSPPRQCLVNHTDPRVTEEHYNRANRGAIYVQ